MIFYLHCAIKIRSFVPDCVASWMRYLWRIESSDEIREMSRLYSYTGVEQRREERNGNKGAIVFAFLLKQNTASISASECKCKNPGLSRARKQSKVYSSHCGAVIPYWASPHTQEQCDKRVILAGRKDHMTMYYIGHWMRIESMAYIQFYSIILLTMVPPLKYTRVANTERFCWAFVHRVSACLACGLTSGHQSFPSGHPNELFFHYLINCKIICFWTWSLL